MKAHEFCYWLQGYFELGTQACLGGRLDLNQEQTECVQKHLALVFKHEIDPSYGDEDHQAELNEIHEVELEVEEEDSPPFPPSNSPPFPPNPSSPGTWRC